MVTFTFLSYGLFLQLVHMFYMFPVESCGLSRPHGSILTKGLSIGGFQLLKLVAPNCPGLLDGHPIVLLSLHNCLGASHLGVKVLP